MSMTINAEALAGAAPIISRDDMYRRGLAASVGGMETSLDLVSAHMWFNLAAMQGHMEARRYRAELALEMTAEEVAEAQRLARAFLSSHRVLRAN